MKLSFCQCDPELLQRIPRAWWMRVVFPRRHLYYCRFCRHTMLVKPVLLTPDTQPMRRPAPSTPPARQH